MKLIACEENFDDIKKFFNKSSNATSQQPRNQSPRTFGNSYSTPRYSIPINISSNNQKESSLSRYVNIISTSESAVEQAKSDLKQDEREDRSSSLIPQIMPHSIKDLQMGNGTHSSGVKRKRTYQPKAAPVKKYTTSIPSTERKKKKKRKTIF